MQSTRAPKGIKGASQKKLNHKVSSLFCGEVKADIKKGAEAPFFVE
ncbi:hypothetical protein GP5015_1810 [gamma proteobacterium HTCC5015]|nr:hypothetical protein GP5015_1810 [gamma proteobacterium HTCC5015]